MYRYSRSSWTSVPPCRTLHVGKHHLYCCRRIFFIYVTKHFYLRTAWGTLLFHIASESWRDSAMGQAVPRRSGFSPRSLLVEFVVDIMALGQVSTHELRIFVSLSFHIWPMHINSSSTLYNPRRWKFHFATKHLSLSLSLSLSDMSLDSMRRFQLPASWIGLTVGTALPGFCAFSALGCIPVAKATGTWSLLLIF